jgi:acetoacetate decarboxylase
VTDDMAMIYGRENLGFPKKLAETATLERDGTHVSGSVTRKGEVLLQMEAELTRPAHGRDLDWLGPPTTDLDGHPALAVATYLVKHPWAASGRSFDHLPRLVRQVTLFTPRSEVLVGTATLELRSARTDPLGSIPVLDVLGSAYGSFDLAMLPGRNIARVWNLPRFLPHAFYDVDIDDIELDDQHPSRRERRAAWRRMRHY